MNEFVTAKQVGTTLRGGVALGVGDTAPTRLQQFLLSTRQRLGHIITNYEEQLVPLHGAEPQKEGGKNEAVACMLHPPVFDQLETVDRLLSEIEELQGKTLVLV